MAPSDFPRARPIGQRGVSSIPGTTTTGRSDAPSPQRRNDGQLDANRSRLGQELMSANLESWVEVASQPSSSSLSSIGDEIVTTGLRVGSTSYPPRRRRSQQQQQHAMPASFIVGHPATQGGATSSQEEYDETESEEDRVMTSSTEAIHPSANLLRQQTTVRASAAVDTDSDSDDDENATALGRPSNTPVFRPQPNAFSHPPSHLTHRHSTGSAPYHQHHHPSHSRPPMPNRPHTRSHRGPPNYMSPAYQADNDAALRASLTTLLSCAAAARGLPKHDERRNVPGAGAGVVPSSQPMELRLVPESELMTDAPPPPPTTPAGGGGAKTTNAQTRTASNSSAPSAPSSNSGREGGKTKRGAATQSNRPSGRATKKKRTSSAAAPLAEGDTDADAAAPFLSSVISPTLLTWVVSAGVVVLVSVVGFGAGYVIGREVGRQEAGAAAASGFIGSAGGNSTSSAAAGCGSELLRAGGGGGGSGGTLRRIRWGGVGRSVAA